MKFGSVGAVIAAASKKDAVPLLKVGSIPIVRRIVLTLQQACLHMGLSYQKAWDMINRLEREVGYAVVTRQHGGKNGGKTCLTDRGQRLMLAFQQYEDELHAFARQRFDVLFRENGLI